MPCTLHLFARQVLDNSNVINTEIIAFTAQCSVTKDCFQKPHFAFFFWLLTAPGWWMSFTNQVDVIHYRCGSLVFQATSSTRCSPAAVKAVLGVKIFFWFSFFWGGFAGNICSGRTSVEDTQKENQGEQSNRQSCFVIGDTSGCLSLSQNKL